LLALSLGRAGAIQWHILIWDNKPSHTRMGIRYEYTRIWEIPYAYGINTRMVQNIAKYALTEKTTITIKIPSVTRSIFGIILTCHSYRMLQKAKECYSGLLLRGQNICDAVKIKSRVARPLFSAGRYHLQAITPCAKKEV